ncbi:RNA-directed DNA polymerase from mobile element jockey-like [Rhizophagus irregularis DAOM 181602=DAOM 197198]|nr:RNA-directed DNA polymerase from mobile element jockey-like [Rhizophagus irregularis DAOM 181602=DAOM 197198]
MLNSSEYRIDKRVEITRDYQTTWLSSILDRNTLTNIVIDKVLVNEETGISTKRLATEPREVKKAVDNDFANMFRKRNTLLDTMTPIWQQIYEPVGKFKEVMESTIEKITMAEWNNTVKELNKESAAGLSGINYRIILQLPEELILFMVKFGNLTLQTGLVPMAWKTSEYNCCGLPGECTSEPIYLVNNFIEDARENSKELWVLTQDMKKAFDSVGLKVLKRAMLCIDIPASLVEWIIALFKHRHLKVATAYGLSDGFTGNDGIDQGDALFPLLWRIFYDPLLIRIQQIKNSRYEMKVTWPNDINDPITWTQYRLQVPVCAYMDDTIFLESSRFRMQNIVDIANEFYIINDIDINAKKSELIIINPTVEWHEQNIELGRDRSIIQATNEEIRVLIPRLIYTAQIMTLSEHDWNHIFAPVMKVVKNWLKLPKNTPSSLLFHEGCLGMDHPWKLHCINTITDLTIRLNSDSYAVTSTQIRLRDAQLKSLITDPIFDCDLQVMPWIKPQAQKNVSFNALVIAKTLDMTMAIDPIDRSIWSVLGGKS